MPQPIAQNTLFYGDNLPILRDYIPDESIDLVYLDPPFNSRRTYNVLFKDEGGKESESQIAAFDDTWHWTRAAEEAYRELVEDAPNEVGQMIGAMRSFIGTNQMMAYLVMMAIRLVELHRVLKPTGSLYLHCDPTASHYLKILLDSIFGASNFINEICWKRTTAKSDFQQGAKSWPRVHDVLFYYVKDINCNDTFHQPFSAHSDEYIRQKYRSVDENGRRYMLDNLTAPGAGSRGHPQYELGASLKIDNFTRPRA